MLGWPHLASGHQAATFPSLKLLDCFDGEDAAVSVGTYYLTIEGDYCYTSLISRITASKPSQYVRYTSESYAHSAKSTLIANGQ